MSRLRRWLAKIPSGEPSSTISGLSVAALPSAIDRFVEQLRQHRLGGERLVIFALDRLHHVVHHVRVALRVVEIVVNVPAMDRAAVVFARAIQIGVRVAEHVAPCLDEADQFDVALVEFARGLGIGVQAGDVEVQMAHAVAILGLRRRQYPLLRVVAEVGIRDHQVRIVFVRRHLGQMVLEDAHGLAHRHDDAELAIGVVVGHHAHAPQGRNRWAASQKSRSARFP